MIDIEQDIYSLISTALRNEFPKIAVAGEYVKAPSQFPFVSIEEADNQVYERTRDSGSNENHVIVLYEVNVFSNLTKGKKSQCKEIINLVDKQFISMGFSRILKKPIPNEEDATIYRMVARYKAVISQDKHIYWR